MDDISYEENEMKKLTAKLCLSLMLTTLALSAFGRNITQTINMYDDEFFKGDVIKLKQLLKDEHPGLRLNKMKIKKIDLVAKSRRGRGKVKFIIGDFTEIIPVYGTPRSFDNPNRRTFDHVTVRIPNFVNQGTWQIKVKGNLIVRRINITLKKKDSGWDNDYNNDYPGQRLVELTRFFNGRKNDHNITTSRYADNRYSFESVLGKIYTEQRPGTKALYECLVGGKDHMLSTNYYCEGQQMLGTAGYILTNKKNGTKPIFRCLTHNGDHFASSDKRCEGQIAEGILGYVL